MNIPIALRRLDGTIQEDRCTEEEAKGGVITRQHLVDTTPISESDSSPIFEHTTSLEKLQYRRTEEKHNELTVWSPRVSTDNSGEQ